MNFHSIIFFLIALVIFSSCAKTEDNIVNPNTPVSENFKYPFTLNSYWLYKSTLQNINVRPDSIRPYISTEPILETGYSVWKNDTIINGINARVLQSNHTSPVHSHSTTEYFINTDTGLVSVSYTVYGTSFGPFNINPQYKFKYKGKNYHSIYDLKRDMFLNIAPDNSNLSGEHFNCIKYPLEKNKEWFFRRTNIIQIQRKKYLDYETVVTPAGTFNCIKIAKINYNGSSEIPDEDFIMYDYFSKIGMVKRSYLIKNIGFLNSSGKIIGYFDLSEEVLLNSYNISP